MGTMKCLHLYSQTMDLYGDSANLLGLAKGVEALGGSCVVDRVELGEPIDPAGYDLVYLGHGKGRNLQAIAPHFRQYASAIREQIEGGQLWLVTGNGRLLFGESFETWEGGKEEGIGLFDYTGVETKEVIVSDVVSRPVFDQGVRCYGFVNRTENLLGGGKHPLFLVERGLGDGAAGEKTEGDLYKNFFGTWQMGPILLRNPVFLREILCRMMGEAYRSFPAPLADRALERTLAELDG